MSRTHAVVIAALLASAAAVGTVALSQTLHLGQASQRASNKASNALVSKRTVQLNRFEASLRAQLGKKPPRLPKMPAAATSGAEVVAAVPTASAPQVRYVRPAPIVIHKHAAGGEHEGAEASRGESGDD